MSPGRTLTILILVAMAVVLSGCTAAGAWDLFGQIGAEASGDPPPEDPGVEFPFDPQDFQYGHFLSFDNSAADKDLVDFPVLVTLSPARVDYGSIKTDGSDLQFLDGNTGAALDHEFEEWNHGGTSRVWVRVPQIDLGSTSDGIWVTYGNSAATVSENPTGVWNSSYVGVWHLHDDFDDSTSFMHHGTNYGSVITPGVVGNGLSFSGAEYVLMGDTAALDLTGEFTLEAWVYKNLTVEQIILGKTKFPNDISYAIGFNKNNDGSGGPFVDISDDGGSAPGGFVQDPGSEAVGAWMHIAAAHKNDKLRLYVNGVEVASEESAIPTILPNTWEFTLGGAANGTDAMFSGMLDEPRVSNKQFGGEWVLAQYLSMTDSYITYGVQQQLF